MDCTYALTCILRFHFVGAEIFLEQEDTNGSSLLLKQIFAGMMSPAIEYEIMFTLFPVIGIVTGEVIFARNHVCDMRELRVVKTWSAATPSLI